MTMKRLAIAGFAYAALLSLCPVEYVAAEDGVAPPAADETLIYVIRPKRLTGSLIGYWIAVNDETVASLRNKKHAIIRAKAGRISLNLALQGVVVGTIALDDRPGETVFLKYRVMDPNITEISADDAQKLLKKSKPMDPIDGTMPNNEEAEALINLSRHGFELMRPTETRLEPDDESAVITFFRRREKVEVDFGIWGEAGFVGALRDAEAMDVRVAPGEHAFLAGNNGTSVMLARVEAGKRYHAWLDYGKMSGRVRLTPVGQDEARDLDKWLADAEWVEPISTARTDRIREREQIMLEFFQPVAEQARAGLSDSTVLSEEHSY